MKKFLIIVLVVAVIAGGLLWQNNYKKILPAKVANTISSVTNPTPSIPIMAATSSDSNITTGTLGTMSHLMVYKPLSDYSSLVWVELSSDKKQVLGFPDPKDIANQVSTSLHNGYFTGNVDKNTAFINIKTDKYAALKRSFTPTQLYSILVYKYPFGELYDCGPKKTPGEDILNANTFIDTAKLSKECNKVI